MAGRVEQRARRSDRLRGMLVVGERRDEDPDDLVADELVDDAVVGDENARGDIVEAVEKGPEAVGDIPSARVVEPRMSANRKDASISAPPWYRSSSWKQALQ